MIAIVQEQFQALASPPPPEREALVLHHRSETCLGEAVVVFVHGWNGDRYNTWGNFPEYVYEDLPIMDVGMYAYVSGKRRIMPRLRGGASAPFGVQVNTLADTLRDGLRDYRAIYLIGHSEGGLLCKAAVSRLVIRDDRETMARIGGLFLMAAAQAGTRLLEFLPDLLSRDAKVLKPDSPVQGESRLLFEDRIDVSADAPLGSAAGGQSRRFSLPTFAVLPDYDPVVGAASAAMHLPSSQIKNAPGTHQSIVKPEHKQADAYVAVLQWIAAEQTRRSESRALKAQEPRVATSDADSQGGGHPDTSSTLVSDEIHLDAPPGFWTRPGSLELRDVLSRAYGAANMQRLRILVASGGFDPSSINFDKPATDVWAAVLEMGYDSGRLADFIRAKVLQDSNVAAHHDAIRRALNRVYPGIRDLNAKNSKRSDRAPVGALDPETLREIVDYVIPHATSESSQQALLNAALFGSTVLSQVIYGGSPSGFATKLVAQLWAYDEGGGADPALRQLLNELRRRYGGDRAAKIDAITRRIWPAG
jgi:pimeloyl-ACP methyl ester carboxylesterase